MLEDAIHVMKEYGTKERAAKAWRELGYVKYNPSNPKSRWVKPEWFLEPRYRWYYKKVPEHIREMIGERAALLTCSSVPHLSHTGFALELMKEPHLSHLHTATTIFSDA